MAELILLTATVTPPPGVPYLHRTDPSARLADYENAFRFYLGLPNKLVDRIVFMENSGHPLDSIRKLAAEAEGKSVEFINFAGLDHPPEYGRGYGEFKMIDHAINTSKLLGAMEPGDRWWKITGRLRVLNLGRMVATAPRDFDVYCDIKTVNNRWMDLRLLAFTRQGYESLLMGQFQYMRQDIEKRAPEQFLMDRLLAARDTFRIVPRFRSQPTIEGLRGMDSSNYFTPKERIKLHVKSVLRRVAPWYWI
ncbi:MAG: hypothetical protein ABSH08_20260 [Tepidisphaeraceae bacterium]|jgi:hypothetical protein